MRKIVSLSVITSLLVIMVLSCQKQSHLSNTDEIKTESLNKDEVLTDFTKSFAKTLTDPSKLNFIRKEADKRVDGDFDVLFAAHKGAEFDGKTLRNAISEKFSLIPPSNIKKSTWNNYISEFISDSIPTLNISIPNIPVNNEADWDNPELSPWIVVITSDVNERTTEELTAFNIQGESFKISAKTPPSHPTIVVGLSERIIAIPLNDLGKKQLAEPCTEPLYIDDTYAYYNIQEVSGCDPYDPPPTSGGGTTTSPYDRDNSTLSDKITKVKFASMGVLDDAEGWWGSDFELKFILIFSNEASLQTLTKYKDSERECLRDGGWLGINPDVTWCSINLPTVDWDKDEYANVMKIAIYEEDSGTITTTTTSMTYKDPNSNISVTNSISYNITDEDYFIGEAAILYTHDYGRTYDTGRMQFIIND